MNYAGVRTVFSCTEHGPVDVPLDLILGTAGQLKIYPEIAEKGYFDISYKKGRLALKAKNYIGLIPISDDVAIHVKPKTTISNLIRMIERSEISITSLSGFPRSYYDEPEALQSPEAFYVHAFTSALENVKNTGVLKKYVNHKTDKELRGRLLMSETVTRFRSKGISYRATFNVHDLTEDNPENRIIKHTAERLLLYFAVQETREAAAKVKQLTKLLQPFSTVNTNEVNADYVARKSPSLIRGLPRSHRFYESVLWLSYLVSTNSGVRLEKVGQANFETVILDAAAIFEGYIRRIIKDAEIIHFRNIRVVDGNKKPVQLFVDNTFFKTQPDYYFLRGNYPLAVADAKYKQSPSTEDRYELLAFCEALAVDVAAFIVPGNTGETHHGTTRGGRTIKVIGIDLSAEDMIVEEELFIHRLSNNLGLH